MITQENDIVLIYYEDNPLTFARIEKISPDVKKDWYHVKLLFLQVPIQVGTWILRDAYINGEEFTMNEKRMRMERVVSPEHSEPSDTQIEEYEKKKENSGGAKVISLASRK